MEKFEDGEHEANGHVHAYNKRKAFEKATEQILREERKHLDDDEARELEPGQYFGPINFLS